MAQEYDAVLGPAGSLTVPEPILAALDVAPGQAVRFLLHDDGGVEVVNPRAMDITIVNPSG